MGRIMIALTVLCLASALPMALATSNICSCLRLRGGPSPPTPSPTPGGPVIPTGPVCSGPPCPGGSGCPAQSNRQCIEDECKCTRGFHYNATCMCVRECTSYGDTYISYPEILLSCPTSSNPTGFPEGPTACKARCDADPNCISYSTETTEEGEVICLVNPCDSLDPVGASGSPSAIASGSLVTLFVRNCAVEE